MPVRNVIRYYSEKQEMKKRLVQFRALLDYPVQQPGSCLYVYLDFNCTYIISKIPHGHLHLLLSIYDMAKSRD